MRKYGFVIGGILLFGLAHGIEVKDFWDARNCVFHNASFSEDENSFKVDYNVLRTPDGTAVPNEFCIFDGNKQMFTPLSFHEPTRLDDKRLAVEAPRTVKALQREVERAKTTGKKQRAMEYGYFVPIFMDVIFPKITKYGEPPKAILEALSKAGNLVTDIVYPVDVTASEMSLSSFITTRKPDEKPGTSLEERKQWSGGAFEISWAEVLPEEFGQGVHYDGTARTVESVQKVRIDYTLLDSLCVFPRYYPGMQAEELDRWVRKSTPYTISNFAWRKDMFKSLMEVGYFASFFAKYIFPRIQKKVEIPNRFQKEGFVVTYFTEAGISGVTVWATAEGLDEKWKGSRQLIPWNDALPENLKRMD